MGSDKLGESGAVQQFLHRIQEFSWHEADEIRVEVRVEVRWELQRRWPVRDTSWNPGEGCLRVHFGTPRRVSDKLEASELRNLHCSNRWSGRDGFRHFAWFVRENNQELHHDRQGRRIFKSRSVRTERSGLQWQLSSEVA